MSAATFDRLAQMCANAHEEDARSCLQDAAKFIEPRDPQHFAHCMQIMEWFGAALALLPVGCEWRKYTDASFTVYAASPYNAKAQVPFEGYGSTHALALTCANLRLRYHQAAYSEARAKGGAA